jgi:hypothetical protein
MNLENDGFKELQARKQMLDSSRSVKEEAIAKYLTYILEDYKGFTIRNANDSMGAAEQRIEGFRVGLRTSEGNKYIKVISGTSAHSFIQKEDDKKFKAGDILKAASWTQPAKNFARGNIYDGSSFRTRITWTGAN